MPISIDAGCTTAVTPLVLALGFGCGVVGSLLLTSETSALLLLLSLRLRVVPVDLDPGPDSPLSGTTSSVVGVDISIKNLPLGFSYSALHNTHELDSATVSYNLEF